MSEIAFTVERVDTSAIGFKWSKPGSHHFAIYGPVDVGTIFLHEEDAAHYCSFLNAVLNAGVSSSELSGDFPE